MEKKIKQNFYTFPKKNYPCQFIKTRTWIYSNILWKKVKKWNSMLQYIQYFLFKSRLCSATSCYHSLVSIVHVNIQKEHTSWNFCNKIDFSGPIARRKMDVTIHPVSCQITNNLKFSVHFLILWVIQDVLNNFMVL